VTDKQLDHSDLDALVLRELSSLPSLAPSRGFQDRVMARVSLPKPAAVVLLQRAGAWALQPRRALALATAYAACVVATVLLAGPWAAAHAGFVVLGASWVAGHVGAWLDTTALAVASWGVRSGVVEALRSAAGSGARLWATVATVAIGYAASGYGLHILLKAPRRSDELARML
jgi:hypothetical protein